MGKAEPKARTLADALELLTTVCKVDKVDKVSMQKRIEKNLMLYGECIGLGATKSQLDAAAKGGVESAQSITAQTLEHKTVKNMIHSATLRLNTNIVAYIAARVDQDNAQDALDLADEVVDALDLTIVGKVPTKTVTVQDKERVVTIRPETAQDGTYYIGIGRATMAKVSFVKSGEYHHVNQDTRQSVQMTVSADGDGYFVAELDKSFTSGSGAATAAAITIGLTGRRNGRVFWKDCKGADCVCQQAGNDD